MDIQANSVSLYINRCVASMTVQLSISSRIHPLQWCNLKQFIHFNPECISNYNDMFGIEPVKTSGQLIRSIENEMIEIARFYRELGDQKHADSSSLGV